MKRQRDCACGKARYEFNAEPSFSFHCHCRQCQRFSGTGHVSQFVISADTFTLKGNVRFYTQKADSGYEVKRGFCENCGSPLFNIPGRMPEKRYIHVASLDEPGFFQPQNNLYEESQQAWDKQSV